MRNPNFPAKLSETHFGDVLHWVIGVDALKGIERKTHCLEGRRTENSAEHSWHIALMAMTLAPHLSAKGGDLLHIIQMLIVHDLVEVISGDTFLYDRTRGDESEQREIEAANALFGELPHPIGRNLLALWREFELGDSLDARMARAIDRLHPMLMNFAAKGKGIPRQTIQTMIDANRAVEDGLPEIWPSVVAMLDEADEQGYSL